MTELLASGLRRCRHLSLPALAAASSISTCLLAGGASGATIGPPLLDITGQCDAIARRNVTAMSECIVAESEARAEILSKWAKFSDAAAQKCVQLGRKTRKYPYAAIAKCLAAEPADVRAAKTTSAR